MIHPKDLLSIKEASVWASGFVGKSVTPANIAYLVNYGRVTKIVENGSVFVAKQDLINYYETYQREIVWKKQLGADLNWALSFETKNLRRPSTFTACTRTKANSFRSLSNTF